ncbi:MAG TPA: sugar transferase [Flavobacteriaceae bacterium]|nr:sugar transferase [Flavobacteriaceae bacterium]HIP26946.1 sugar transferase [Flavobacteriaceae bacterium]
MLSQNQQISKRLFDIVLSVLGIFFLTIPILILTIFASISTKKNGIFKQERIGQHAKPFQILKIRSMIENNSSSHITIKNDQRITSFGKFIRKYNLDELPQIFNVLKGEMSFVGPRPDVKGYADLLQGNDKIILSLKPGITGPATLAFQNEEELLAKQDKPKQYNDEVLWPKKVTINKEYITNWSLISDLKYIIKTLF